MVFIGGVVRGEKGEEGGASFGSECGDCRLPGLVVMVCPGVLGGDGVGRWEGGRGRLV